jgi:hypothetical protein
LNLQTENISSADSRYPARLHDRFGAGAPPKLTAFGNLDLLALPKTALFCSARCPGRVILPTYDQAAKWRDTGRCVIGGFHSPVEKECLHILLRGDKRYEARPLFRRNFWVSQQTCPDNLQCRFFHI